MIRRKTDLCFLCESNQADKTNSHIIPKFMTKSMIQDGKTKKAYRISTDSMHEPTLTAQDTPKQNYILCSECEDYFNVLETYFANKIHKTIRDNQSNESYEENKILNNRTIKRHTNANPIIVSLLIYSIFWRCHISDHNLFKRFKLSEDEALQLRKLLLSYKSVSQSALLEQLKMTGDAFDFISYLIFTPDIHKNRSKNFIFTDSTSCNPARILAAEYLICMFLQPISDVEISQIISTEKHPTIVLVDESEWGQMIDKFIKVFVLVSETELDQAGLSYLRHKDLTPHTNSAPRIS